MNMKRRHDSTKKYLRRMGMFSELFENFSDSDSQMEKRENGIGLTFQNSEGKREIS